MSENHDIDEIEKENLILGRSKNLLKKFGLERALYVGITEDNKKLYIDSIKPHVIFICGARGSGKSYTMGVIAEELAYRNDAVASLIIDPIGVFWSMKHPNKDEREIELLRKFGLEPRGFENIRVLVPIGVKDIPKDSFDGYLSFKPSELRAADWAFAFGIDRFSPAGMLIEAAIKKAGDDFTIDDLIRIIETDPELMNKERGFSKQTRRSVMSRLESAKYWGIFGKEPTPLEEIALPGVVTVIDTSFLEEQVAALVTGILARKILERRKVESRKEALGEVATFPPVWFFIDEAHTLVPKDSKTAATDSIIEYVKQGRKPGCSMVLATQQPSAINSEVLSQLDIMFVHQLVFEDDIKAVSKRMPANMPKEWNVPFIRSLGTGKAAVGDRETMKTAVVKVRPRMSHHEGRSALAINKPQYVLKKEDLKKEESKKEDEEVENEEKKEKIETIQEKQETKEDTEKTGKIKIIKTKISMEEAEKIAKKELEKILFIPREKFVVKMQIYWPYYLIHAYGENGPFYFLYDAVKGELEESKGLQLILGKQPIVYKILAAGEDNLFNIADKVGADVKIVKLYLNKLIKENLVRYKKTTNTFKPKIRLPFNIKEFDADFEFEENFEGRVLKNKFKPENNLYKTLGIKKLDEELIYKKFAYFKTDKNKEILIDLTNGEIKKEKLRLKV